MGTGSIYNCGKNADFPHFPLSVVKLETTLITNKIEHCVVEVLLVKRKSVLKNVGRNVLLTAQCPVLVERCFELLRTRFYAYFW